MNRLSTPELTILRKPTGVSGPMASTHTASPMGNPLGAPMGTPMGTHVGPHAVEDNALSPVRIGIGAISRHHASFVQLYYAIEARRTSAMPLVVQFTSPTPHTGATTVASGYARVAADDCAQPVLFIDCNATPPVRRPAKQDAPMVTLADVLRRGLPLADAIRPARDAKNLLWARLASGDRPLLALGGDRLQSLLDMLRASYPVIVLDTPPTDVPEAAAVSRYCDGSVLVVEAGRTRQWEIENAKALLERLGGQPVGAVLNRERTLLPRWMGGH